MTRAHRHRGSSFNATPVVAVVIALHVVVGGGGLWLAKTQAGHEFARVYNIKLFEPPKPAEVEQEETPPPPPPPPVQEAALAEAPELSAPAATSAVSAAPPRPSIGGGGTNWEGKFSGAGAFDGPEGAFHAAITGRFRRHYREPSEAFGTAELELAVTPAGVVRSYRLVTSSGSTTNDQAILQAAARVQAEGIGVEPPSESGRMVTVRFVPST